MTEAEKLLREARDYVAARHLHLSAYSADAAIVPHCVQCALLTRIDAHLASGGWIPVTEEKPDADIAVLICLSDGEVWTGSYDGQVWRYESGDRIDSADVEFWAHFPEPPKKG